MPGKSNQPVPFDVARLLELLGDELKIYKQIQKLTEKQAQLLAKDDIDSFNNSLEKRAELIEQIKGLHRESDPLMQSYVSTSESSKDRNGDIDKTIKEIRQTLEVCSGLNEDNIAAMKAKTEDHTSKIKEQNAKRKGIGGYAQSVPNTPEMFDTKT